MEVKKRIIPVFVAVLMMFSMMPMMSGGAYADVIGIVYEGLSYTLHDNDYLVFNGVEDENAEGINRTTGELTIHTYIHGKRVKKIGTNVFKEKLPSGIHKVIFPIGLEEIEEGAFFQCSGLKSVSFPQSVSMIGQYAFHYCQDLETVSFEEEGSSCYIGYSAFSGCWNLKEVTIPKRVIQIDGGAFDGCDALTTVHYGGTREQWEAIRGSGKPSIDLVDFRDTPEPQIPISIDGKKVALSAKAFTYNGKVRKPKIKTIDGKPLVEGTDYTVKWSNTSPKNVGKYTLTIKGKGDYTGTAKASFKINPKGTKIKSLAGAKKAITVKWNKQSAKMSKARITGCKIQLATDSKFTRNKKTVTVKGYKTVSKKIKNLKSKKKYFVRIRTYKTIGGENYYSPWSKAKSVKTR